MLIDFTNLQTTNPEKIEIFKKRFFSEDSENFRNFILEICKQGILNFLHYLEESNIEYLEETSPDDFYVDYINFNKEENPEILYDKNIIIEMEEKTKNTEPIANEEQKESSSVEETIISSLESNEDVKCLNPLPMYIKSFHSLVLK